MAQSKLFDYLLLGLLALIWSTSFMLIKLGLDGFEPLTLTAIRLCIAAMILGLAMLACRQSLPMSGPALQIFLVVGIFANVLPFGLISLGEVYIDSAMAAILMGIMPISTFVLAHLFIPAEPMTGRKVIGVIFGFAGLLTLVGLSTLGSIGSHVGGQLLVLSGAISYSITAVYVRTRSGFGGLQLAFGVSVVAALSSVTLAFILEQPLASTPDLLSGTAAVLLGIFPTALASLIYFRTIRTLGVVTFAQINYLIPVLGSIWGVLLLGERLGYRIILALGLVLIGIYFIQPRLRSAER